MVCSVAGNQGGYNNYQGQGGGYSPGYNNYQYGSNSVDGGGYFGATAAPPQQAYGVPFH